MTGTADPADARAEMDVLEAIHRRRSVREYGEETVPDATIERLIDAAVQAPSAMNEQPWAFYVLRDPELLQRISDEAKAHIVRTTAAGLLPATMVDMIRKPGFDIFYQAPVVLLICATNATPWATIDCALAGENVMLAAPALGLGSCWIGLSQGWFATPEARALLKLPQHHVPIAPIALGAVGRQPHATGRKVPEVRWFDPTQPSERAVSGHLLTEPVPAGS